MCYCSVPLADRQGGTHEEFLVALCKGCLSWTFFILTHLRVDVGPCYFLYELQF